MDFGLPGRVLRVTVAEMLRPLTAAVKRRRALVALGRREGRRAIGDIYRAIAVGDMRRAEAGAWELLDARLLPSVAIEATVAALLVALATRQFAAADNLISFLSVAHHADDCRRALARAQRRVRLVWRRRHESVAPALAHTLLGTADWATFVQSVHAQQEPCRDESTRPPTPTGEPPTPACRALDRRPSPVVVHITGGLGNQLFQYVAAYRYAVQVGGELRIDMRAYRGTHPDREFLLSRLHVPILRAGLFDIARARRHCHFEPQSGTDDIILHPSGGRWLSGYWESPRYFVGVEDQLRRWFQPAEPSITIRARAQVEQARGTRGSVVGVHVRRGDRAGGARAATMFPTLPTTYYQAAAARFPPGTGFLVFSDTPEDIEWCKQHLDLNGRSELSFASEHDPILDFFTLAACDHLIISASTFSWWAAWLNPHADKIVIAPNFRQGYGPRMARRDPTRLMLPGWQVITIEPHAHCFRVRSSESGLDT
jgi:hypothetical protein